MWIKFIELALLIIISLISDIKEYKIYNWVVFPFILIGFATNYYFYGTEGVILSIKGFLLPVILLFILFALRMLGAGDIKLLGAVGAIMGPEFVFYAGCYSFIFGGVISIIIIIYRKNGIERMRYLFFYLRECFLTQSFRPYSEFKIKNAGHLFRFSYAITAGTLFTILKLS